MKLVIFLLMPMIKATTIFVFLFLFSCTVTKRVHRSGFHIEWKKNYHAQKVQKTSPSDISKGKITQLNSDKLQIREVQLIAVSAGSFESSVSAKRNKKHDSNQEIEAPKGNQEVSTLFLTQTRKYNPFQKFTRQKETISDRGSPRLRRFGYVMLAIASFLLLGSIFAFFGLWSLEWLFYGLVFSGSGIIAGILGLILFMLIFIVCFSSYALVEYLLGGHIIGLIATAVCLVIGVICLLIAKRNTISP